MQTVKEQLGSFYLGGVHSFDGPAGNQPVLYDARDLTTHAVCVGMTGSGKTGLCIGLLEEAALDKVPALLIDPKGDITNLLLQFPELRTEDFLPWINPDDARRKDQSIEEYAANTADQWRNGLAQWGIDGTRIEALRESADFTIFTPGSSAGVGVNIAGGMAAPAGNFDDDAEMLRERISGTVAALLGLIDVKGDPVRSREGVLLATIFEHYWRQGEDLDLAKIILAIQDPPFQQLGVFDLDTFYPPKERLELAMAFNSLIASPSFGEWLSGEPLDVASLLFLDDGTPRHSVFYLAHLSDSERMFFVTLLMESVITWMRSQSGTTSLRALLYFDEIFGFFPPTAEPPSKRPLLTIMKQARAFGLGAVLVTQNPVDIDYKGLSNAGTWFIGKMQTERDKARVLEGLKGAITDAGGAAEKLDWDALISRLDSRVFLLHNVHADAPQVFHTRLAMSYLRGPLTRPQVQSLMDQAGKRGQVEADVGSEPDSHGEVAVAVQPAQAVDSAPGASAPAGYLTSPAVLDPEVAQCYLPVTVSADSAKSHLERQAGIEFDVARQSLVYQPGVLGRATVHFVDRKWDVETARDYLIWSPVSNDDSDVDWEDALALDVDASDLADRPSAVEEAHCLYFVSPPDAIDTARELNSAQNALADWLYHGSRISLGFHGELELVQQPDESHRDYLVRLRQAAREARDAEVDAIEDKYEDKMESVQDRIDSANRSIAGLEADLAAHRQQELIGIGENALGFFLNRRSSRAFSGISSRRSKTVKAHHALEAAREKVEDLQEDIAELQEELEAASADITVKWASALDNLDTLELKPRRTDLDIQLVAIGWAPYWLFEPTVEDGPEPALVPAFDARPPTGDHAVP